VRGAREWKPRGPGSPKARLVLPLSLGTGVVVVGTVALAGGGEGSGARGSMRAS